MPVSAKPAAPPTASPTPSAALIAPLAVALERRGLAAPALLYLSSHRPLAFAAGQLLALAAPLAAVLGLRGAMGWAHLLSTPEGVGELQAALESCRLDNLPDAAAGRDQGGCRAASPTYIRYTHEEYTE